MRQTLTLVWGALAMSQLVYVLVPTPTGADGTSLPSILPLVLGGVALGEAGGIVVWLRIKAFHPIDAGRLDPTSEAGARELFTALIVAWALAESIAIQGLVLRLLGFGALWSLPFALGGALLMLYGRPWSDRLRGANSSAALARGGTPIG